MSRKALLVGVNAYANEPLAWCVDDATAMQNVLELPEYGFDCRVLHDTQASTRNIKDSIKDALQKGTEAVVFYFAGHGVVTEEGGYLLTIESEDHPDEGVDLSYLARAIAGNSHATAAVVVILDCCQSGAATVGHGSARIALKGDDLAQYVAMYSERRALLAACQESQYAQEDPDLGHGVFTHHVLEALMGGAADEYGVVTAMGVYDYVARAFSLNQAQAPVFKGDMNGRIELGSGLKTNAAKREEDELDAIDRQAEGHVNGLQAHLAKMMGDHAEWKASGFLSACKQVTPVLEWLNNRARQYPQLLTRKKFRDAQSALIAKCKPLQTLEPHLRLEDGIVEAQLGHGSYGSVWKVRSSHGAVAVKVYHSHDLGIAEKVQRFRQGYAANKRLDHPHIVKVRRLDECPLSFSMDYIDGPNLRSWTGTTDDPITILTMMVTVADTLRHAHSRGVVHRDVKPENILVLYKQDASSYETHLTDFDLAWYSTASLQTREAIGTVFYAAPEQLAKHGSAASRSPVVDVYSFGQLLFYVFTTTDPKPLDAADNVKALSKRAESWEWSQPAEMLVRLYADCTQKSPDKRPSGMEQVTRRLSEI